MKRLLNTVFIVAVLGAVIYASFHVKTVGVGEEGVRVTREGDATVAPTGFVVLRPGESLIIYPVGDRSYRIPDEGNLEIRMADGSLAALSLEFDLSIPDGTALRFYESFSEDFDAAFQRLVENVAGIEAAVTQPADRSGLPRLVREGVEKELTTFGVTVVLRSSSFATATETPGAGLPTDVEATQRPPVKLIIIGVDGGDWLNIKPMIAQGKLPNFRRLVEEGATGPLRSEEPMLSPLLWTTMATGKYPEDHGILNFTVVDPATKTRVPITRLYRKVDAFWNMLSDYQRSVCVTGWLATDPAEKINGVMVTDKVGYLAYAPDDTSAEQSAASVYPRDQFERVTPLIVHGRDITWEQTSRLVNIPRAEYVQSRDLPFDPRNSINNLILLYASTLTFRNVAIDLLEKENPDVLAVYFEFVDAVSHLFMLHAPPRLPDIPEAEYARNHRAVGEAYVIQDAILGEFMDRLDDNSVLMVVSDHGFKSAESRLRNRPEIWAGNAAKWHRVNGIIGFYGSGVRRGHEITGASILDVTPTILALQGLPRAADMPGKVLATAFESSLQSRFNPNTVSTLQRKRDTDVTDVASSAASKETMKKLGALGYLTPDNADAHNNLGQRYEERGDYLKAIEEYRKALAMRPEFHSVWNNIAVCFGKLKRYGEAEQALLKAVELKPDDFYAMNNLAVLYLETGKMSAGKAMAERCVATEPGYANGRITLGSIYAMSGDLDRAEVEYKAALDLDPENRTARENLGRVEQQRELNR